MTIHLKDLQVWCHELDNVTDKETLDVMGLKAKGAGSRRIPTDSSYSRADRRNAANSPKA